MTNPVDARKPTKRSLITWLFYALVMLFFAIYLRGVQWSALTSFDFQPQYLLLALPISLVVRFMLPLAWMLLIQQLGEKVSSYRELSYVYAKAWMGRYIPGKIAWLAGKVYFASQQGISRTVLGTTSLIEAGVQLATALVVAFLLLGFSGQSGQIDGRILVFASLTLVAVAGITSPPVFNFFSRTFYRIIRKAELDRRFHFRFFPLLKVCAMYMCVHAVGSLAYFLLVKTVHPEVGVELIPFLGAVYLLAGVLGTLAVFAPSGIGVREGVQAVLLGSVLPKEVIVVVLILARLWSAVMDVSFFLLAKTFASTGSRKGSVVAA